MKKEKINFIFNPFNVDIQYCLNNNISYIDVIIIKYINYCLSNYKMIKIKNVNEKGEEIEYVWLDIDTLCFSLQMLELSKISMIRRIAKMCDENKILKLVKCDEGTKFKKTYYSLPIDTINAINGYESKQCENSNSEIEFNNSLKDNFISSKEKRIVGSGMNTSSLDIYKDWFCSQSFNNRNIYRIINPEDRNNELGNIVDLSICDLLKAVKNYTNTQSENLFSYSNYTNNKPTKQIIDDLFNDVSFLRQLFPLEFTSLSHSPDDEQIKAKIETKKNELYTKALRIIND